MTQTRAPALPPASVQEALEITAEDLLGEGGEAWVFDLGADRVARVHRLGASRNAIDARNRLLAELTELGESADRVRFETPRVLDAQRIEGYIVTIEARLAGESLRVVLEHATGARRAELIRSYLDTAADIGALGLKRPWCGDLCRAEPIRVATWREYLEASAARSLRDAGPEFAKVDACALAEALPEAPFHSVVHLDAFPGNMLCDGRRVTAVIDFGTVTVVGDPRLDPLTAAVYLQDPMTPSATDSDRAIARAWLEERDLIEYLDPAERWTAAFWAQAPAHTSLHAWCRRTLLER